MSEQPVTGIHSTGGDGRRSDTTGGGAGPCKSRLLNGLLLVFCCGHAVFLISSLKPAPPVPTGPGHPAMDFYRIALGGRQQWNMFETIPVLHSLDVWVEGRDSAGEKITTGCIVPGFRPYPKPEQARYYNAFYRLLLSNENVAYREVYLEKMAQLLPTHHTSGAAIRWSVVADQRYTRNLVRIRRDGHMAMPAGQVFDLASPGDDSP